MSFDALYGLEVSDCSDSLVRGRVPVRDELFAGSGGHVHGGVYAAIAEGLAVRGTGAAVAPGGSVAVGLANQVTSLAAVTEGSIHAVAIPRHRGRTTWVWEVELSDDKQRRCAVARVTIAVRDS